MDSLMIQADDFVVHDKKITIKTLSGDFDKIKDSAYNWKMSFNPAPRKQTRETIFSRKINKFFHLLVRFNGLPVNQITSSNYVILDTRLGFDERYFAASLTTTSQCNATLIRDISKEIFIKN